MPCSNGNCFVQPPPRYHTNGACQCLRNGLSAADERLVRRRFHEQEILIQKLTSMCRAAGGEIQAHWAAHCDAEGNGPSSLVSRLLGELPPDDYGPR